MKRLVVVASLVAVTTGCGGQAFWGTDERPFNVCPTDWPTHAHVDAVLNGVGYWDGRFRCAISCFYGKDERGIRLIQMGPSATIGNYNVATGMVSINLDHQAIRDNWLEMLSTAVAHEVAHSVRFDHYPVEGRLMSSYIVDPMRPTEDEKAWLDAVGRIHD